MQSWGGVPTVHPIVLLLDCVWPRVKQRHHHCFSCFVLQRCSTEIRGVWPYWVFSLTASGHASSRTITTASGVFFSSARYNRVSPFLFFSLTACWPCSNHHHHHCLWRFVHQRKLQWGGATIASLMPLSFTASGHASNRAIATASVQGSAGCCHNYLSP